jgi:hypothetical protein
MPPRPIHRWKSFWLGILVIVFLGWAWARSIHFGEMVLFGVPAGPSNAIIGQSGGMVSFTALHPPAQFSLICHSPIAGDHLSKVSAWRDRHGRPHYGVPAPAHLEWQECWWTFSLAHWLLILLFTGGWLAALGWRSRWLQHQATPHHATMNPTTTPPPVAGLAVDQ